jgi:DHA1 family multidrug resistance protein-like MFS transporter
MQSPLNGAERNRYVITFATFIGFASFTLVMPFLPFYFQLLGVTEVADVALWSGVSLGVTPAMTAVFAPLWGRLADRFGRKIMVERSLVSFTVTMAAMAFATRPWHILALRILQGFFAGYGAIALAMAAESAPPARVAEALGTVQTSQSLGPALGPVIGGTLAQLVGLRQAFLIAAGCYGVAFLLMLLLYEETRDARGRPSGRGETTLSIRDMLQLPGFGLGMALVFVLQFVDRSFGPILPLYVAQSGVEPARLAVVSGLLFSTSAAAGALGHGLCARALHGRSARSIVAAAAVIGAAGALLFTLVASTAWLTVATAGVGLAVGLAITGVYTVAAHTLPASAHATGFGLFASAGLSAVAVSPMISGVVGSVSLRAVFLIDAGLFAVLAAAAFRIRHDV